MNELFNYDKRIRKYRHVTNILGIDEAGRGPLAGPLVVASCVLPLDFNNDDINDSKKITDKKRRELYELIKKNALAYDIKIVPIERIDEINILEADREAMKNSFLDIKKKIDVDYVITDYMNIKIDVPLLSMAKADATSLSVACASILAKVTRDNLMIELDKKYPDYHFKNNKGYATKYHLQALEKYGFIKGIHRLSFEPVKSMNEGVKQLSLFEINK